MNSAIELHDSTLGAIVQEGTSAVLSFSPAYVHRSDGQPGVDSGSGWTQAVTLTFADAIVSALIAIPCSISDGWLRSGARQHSIIPVPETIEDHCELWLLTTNAETVTVCGNRLAVLLHGEASYLGEFP